MARYGNALVAFGRQSWSAWLTYQLAALELTPSKLARGLKIVAPSRVGEWLRGERLVTPDVAFAVGRHLRAWGASEASGSMALFASGHVVPTLQLLQDLGAFEPAHAVETFCLLPLANARALPRAAALPADAQLAARQIAGIDSELELRAWAAVRGEARSHFAEADRDARASLAWVYADSAIASAEVLSAATDFPVLDVIFTSWGRMCDWAAVAEPDTFSRERHRMELAIPP